MRHISTRLWRISTLSRNYNNRFLFSDQKKSGGIGAALKSSEEQLRMIRNFSAHNPSTIMQTKAAYTLDEADDE